MPEACENHKLDLAVEVLETSGMIRLQALGTSMLPTIWPGDILDIERKPAAEIVRGDIVLLTRENRFVIHRLIEKQDSVWITRGDSLPQNDLPESLTQVLGKVSIIRRRNRNIFPSAKVSRKTRTLAWMFCHCDRLRNITVRIHSFWQRRVRRKLNIRPIATAQAAAGSASGQVGIS
jgi:signal peptidase I